MKDMLWFVLERGRQEQGDVGATRGMVVRSLACRFLEKIMPHPRMSSQHSLDCHPHGCRLPVLNRKKVRSQERGSTGSVTNSTWEVIPPLLCQRQDADLRGIKRQHCQHQEQCASRCLGSDGHTKDPVRVHVWNVFASVNQPRMSLLHQMEHSSRIPYFYPGHRTWITGVEMGIHMLW